MRISFIRSVLSAICVLVISLEVSAQRVVVISGGGSRGAWGGGVAESLFKEKNYRYDIAIGTSTGSLLAPFVITGKFEEVKESYTSVTQKSIFNVNPFKSQPGKEDQVKFLPAIFRIIFGKKTIGESKNLRKLILRDIPIEVYEQMLDYEFMVTVVNFSTAETRYFSNRDYDTRVYNCTGLERREQKECQKKKDSVYNEMINWIWASGNQPLFMSLLQTKTDTATRVTKRGKIKPVTDKHYWVDGGIRENIALLRGMQYLLNNSNYHQTDTIDAIINNTTHPNLDTLHKPKILKSLFRTISILTYDSRQNDLQIPGDCFTEGLSDDSESSGNIVVNMYFMSEDTYKTHPESLVFNVPGMTKLWALGNNYQQSAEMKTCIISKDNASKLIQEAVEYYKVKVQAY